MLEAGQRVLARLIVRGQQEQALVAGILGVFAENLVNLIVLVGGDEEVLVALGPGEIRGAGIRADQKGATVCHRLVNRHQDVGKDWADDEVDIVALD